MPGPAGGHSQIHPVQEGGVAAVGVSGRFAFDAATHRDFLGACLGTGVQRSKVGDILVVGEEGAHILVVPDLVQHLEATLVQVAPVQHRQPWHDVGTQGSSDKCSTPSYSCPIHSRPTPDACKDWVLFLLPFDSHQSSSVASLDANCFGSQKARPLPDDCKPHASFQLGRE